MVVDRSLKTNNRKKTNEHVHDQRGGVHRRQGRRHDQVQAPRPARAGRDPAGLRRGDDRPGHRPVREPRVRPVGQLPQRQHELRRRAHRPQVPPPHPQPQRQAEAPQVADAYVNVIKKTSFPRGASAPWGFLFMGRP